MKIKYIHYIVPCVALLAVSNSSIAGDINPTTAKTRTKAELQNLAYRTYFVAMPEKEMKKVQVELQSLTPNDARSVAQYARGIAQSTGQSSQLMQSAIPNIDRFESRLTDYIQTTFGQNKTIWNLTPDEYIALDDFLAADSIERNALSTAVNTINAKDKYVASAASSCTYDASWPNKFNRASGRGGYLPSGTGRVYNTPGETCDFKAISPSRTFRNVYGVSLAMHNCVIWWGGFNGLSAKSDYSAAIIGYGRLAACTAFLGANEWYVKNYLAFKK